MKVKTDWKALYKQAQAAGYQAVKGLQVAPMIVQQHANLLDDRSPVTQQWVVEGGPCGFAWISIRPGNCAFANWLKKNQLGKTDSYAGGVKIWVS